MNLTSCGLVEGFSHCKQLKPKPLKRKDIFDSRTQNYKGILSINLAGVGFWKPPPKVAADPCRRAYAMPNFLF